MLVILALQNNLLLSLSQCYYCHSIENYVGVVAIWFCDTNTIHSKCTLLHLHNDFYWKILTSFPFLHVILRRTDFANGHVIWRCTNPSNVRNMYEKSNPSSFFHFFKKPQGAIQWPVSLEYSKVIVIIYIIFTYFIHSIVYLWDVRLLYGL